MGKRKEKYARELERRLGMLENRVDKLAVELHTRRSFEECLAGVRRRMAEEERKENLAGRRGGVARREAGRRAVWGLSWMMVLICLLLFALTVSVGGMEPVTAGDRPGKGTREQTLAAEATSGGELAAVIAENGKTVVLNAMENARISHYCPCSRCCGKSDGITASGVPAREGVTVAVDPAVIPLGSWVRVGEDWYQAQDTGVSGGAVDVFVGDHQEALELGIRRETVWWAEEE